MYCEAIKILCAVKMKKELESKSLKEQNECTERVELREYLVCRKRPSSISIIQTFINPMNEIAIPHFRKRDGIIIEPD
jgi:hypothetical protein